MAIDWNMVDQYPVDRWEDYYDLTCPICCGSDIVRELLHETLYWCALDPETRTKIPGWEQGCYRSLPHEMAAHMLDHAELTEHGTGIGFSWATADGYKLLGRVEKMRQEK